MSQPSVPTLTETQRNVLRTVIDFIAANGYPPTRVEVAAAHGYRSPNAADEQLRALARKGYIRIAPGTARGIVILKPLEEDHDA